jgi:acetyl esterase/lipase
MTRSTKPPRIPAKALMVATVIFIGILWRVGTSWQAELFFRDVGVRRAGTLVKTAAYGIQPEQTLEVWYPRKQNSTRSAVLFFHGGGWITGSRTWIRFSIVRRLLNQGFVVANADYRLRDMEYAVDDADAAWNWFRREVKAMNVDPSRVVLGGESAGAHLALYTAFRSSQPPGAVISLYGSSDIATRIEQPHILSLLPLTEDPLTAAARLSPVKWVRFGLPPVVSVHGVRDQIVPVTQPQALAVKLQEAGVLHKGVYLPDSAHEPPDEQLDGAWDTVFEFLRSNRVRMLQ